MVIWIKGGFHEDVKSNPPKVSNVKFIIDCMLPILHISTAVVQLIFFLPHTSLLLDERVLRANGVCLPGRMEVVV